MRGFQRSSAMLERCLADGIAEIDNNLVENAIRPTAVGKKNWLFIGRDSTGWRSAVIYSVIASGMLPRICGGGLRLLFLGFPARSPGV